MKRININNEALSSLHHKFKIMYFLFKNKRHDFSTIELAKHLEDHMSESGVRNYLRILRIEGLLVANDKKRYCSITCRPVIVYQLKALPPPVKMLFRAQGLIN